MRLNLPMFDSLERTVSRWASSLNATEILAPDEVIYDDMTVGLASYNAVHTLTNVKYLAARGSLIGSKLDLYIYIAFDITAGAGSVLTVDIPYTLGGPSDSQQYLGCAVVDGGSPTPGTAQGVAGTGLFYIRNSGATNFAIAANKEIHLFGAIEVVV